MSIKKLSNIPLTDFRKFLSKQGLNIIKTSKGRGGHEKWSKLEVDRPITIQTHINSVLEFIVQQVLRYFKMNRNDFFKHLKNI